MSSMAIDLLPVLANGWVPLLTRLTLGGLLLAAGWTKLRQPQRFEASLEQLGLDDDSRGGRATRAAALRLIPAAECLLGACLVSGLLTRPAAFGAAALFALFGVAVAGAVRRRVPVELHCGPGLNCRVSGWTVARNLLLTAAALIPATGAGGPLALDSLFSGAVSAPLPLAEVVPAAGLWLFATAAGRLVPAAAALLRPRPVKQQVVSS